eukprot:scaffold18206_cov39-Tisochrysis_lutea.AAC.2
MPPLKRRQLGCGERRFAALHSATIGRLGAGFVIALALRGRLLHGPKVFGGAYTTAPHSSGNQQRQGARHVEDRGDGRVRNAQTAELLVLRLTYNIRQQLEQRGTRLGGELARRAA